MERKLGESIFPLNEEMGFRVGDEAAHRAAAALADRLDAPTIVMLVDALAFLSRVGGQLYVGTVRQKINAQGQPAAKDEPGEYQTFGMALVYESRDASFYMAKPPEQVLGIPVLPLEEHMEMAVESGGPAEPEVEPDLRDEIEAEVAAAIEQAEDEPELEPTPAAALTD